MLPGLLAVLEMEQKESSRCQVSVAILHFQAFKSAAFVSQHGQTLQTVKNSLRISVNGHIAAVNALEDPETQLCQPP